MLSLVTAVGALASAVAAVVGPASSGGAQRASPAFTFPIRVHASPAVGSTWFARQLAVANHRFAPAGVAFVQTDRFWLDANYQNITTLHVLHEMVSGDADDHVAIDVFIVESFVDTGDPDHNSRIERGLSLRPGHTPGWPGFVLLTQVELPVLTHELGHFFELRHTPRGTDLMSEHEVQDVPFSATQVSTIAATAASRAASRMPPVVFDPSAPWPGPSW